MYVAVTPCTCLRPWPFSAEDVAPTALPTDHGSHNALGWAIHAGTLTHPIRAMDAGTLVRVRVARGTRGSIGDLLAEPTALGIYAIPARRTSMSTGPTICLRAQKYTDSAPAVSGARRARTAGPLGANGARADMSTSTAVIGIASNIPADSPAIPTIWHLANTLAHVTKAVGRAHDTTAAAISIVETLVDTLPRTTALRSRADVATETAVRRISCQVNTSLAA